MFQFRRFPTYAYVFSVCYTGMTPCRFPHSEICGSRAICASPQLIAACHVLLRLPVPRHSPCALSNLTFELSEFHLRVKSFASQKLYLPLTLLNLSRFLSCLSFNFQGTFLALPSQKELVGSSGLEPPTSRLSGARSNRLSYEPIWFFHGSGVSRPLVEMNGFEPMTPCLQSRCSPN